ncbi:MAG: Smr/MutS family protein [Thiohalobacterales bacterium]
MPTRGASDTMNRPKKPSPDDIDLFRRSVGTVRKVSSDTVAPPVKRRSPRPRSNPAVETHTPLAGFSAGGSSEISAEDTLFFARPGLQQRQLQRLRRGQLRVEAELDMHGMTIPVAETEVARFLAQCHDQHVRSVRIIHGKGYGSREAAPVLKNRINHWLRQHHDVLAFCSTPRDRGGTGAINVLLRSSRPGGARTP